MQPVNRIQCNVRCNVEKFEDGSSCVWNYNGQGIAYQVLAGPSFIIVYSLGCIVMGVLCQRFSR